MAKTGPEITAEPSPATKMQREIAYIVLKEDVIDEGTRPIWVVVAEDVKAASPTKAVEKHAEANKHATDIAGDYVAVASNRFNVVPVGAKQDVVLTIGHNGDKG